MAIDLERLSPAPWIPNDTDEVYGPDNMTQICARSPEETDRDFIALARNAFEVTMRRGWYAQPLRADRWLWTVHDIGIPPLWCVVFPFPAMQEWIPRFYQATGNAWPDPYTALVEADRWFRENVEVKSNV